MTPSSATSRSSRSPSPTRGGSGSRSPRSTPRAAGAERRSARRHRTGALRRRTIGTLVLAGIVTAIVLLTLPLAKRAVNAEFGLPLRDAATIRAQAAAKHLDPALIAAVIYAETKFDPRTSPTGAIGLMQVEPATAQYLARRSGATTFRTSDLNHAATNIAYGSYYLRELLDDFDGSEVLALAAYNGGATNVTAWERRAQAAGHTLRVAEIPFPETRAYVAKVLRAQREYRHKYARQLGYG